MIKLFSCICKKLAPCPIGLKLSALKLISMMHGINRSKEGHNNIPLSQTRTVHVIQIFEFNFEL